MLSISQMALVVKNLPANAGDMRHGFDPWVGRHSEESTATHSSILAWKIPWTEEPQELQSMGSQRGGHDGINLTCARMILILRSICSGNK